ncbi:MAG: hypothetical protein RSF86_13420 [Angelakisella sp.]
MNKDPLEQVERQISCRDRLARCLSDKLERLAPASHEYAQTEGEIDRLKTEMRELLPLCEEYWARWELEKNMVKP